MLSTSFTGLSSALGGGLTSLLAAIISILISFSPLSALSSSDPAPEPALPPFIQEIPVGGPTHGGTLIPWQQAEILDQHTIAISFGGTFQSCGSYRHEIAETDTSVIISLYTRSLAAGQQPPVYDSPEEEIMDQSCHLIPINYRTQLTTEAPVGDRDIVDAYYLD